MNTIRNRHSLTEFTTNASEFLQHLKETGAPLVLTTEGKSTVVVQDAAAYQQLLDELDEAKTLEVIRQGRDEMRAGQTITLEEFKAHVRQKHGINV